MANFLTTKCNFAHGDIRLLTDARATTQGIRERLNWLLDGLKAGDRAFSLHSGHGAQVATPLQHGAARSAEGARHRRGPQQLERRGLPPARPRRHPRRRAGRRWRRPSTRCAPGSTSSRATTPTPATCQTLAATLDRHDSQNAVFYMAIPPVDVPDGRRVAGVGRPQQAGPDRRREALRPRPGVGPASSTPSCTSRSRRSTSSASTTTSARRASRTCWCSASPTRCSSRCGTGTTCAACRSRWPRRSASRAAAASTTRSARSATWCRTTCCRSWPCWRWSRRSAPRPSYLQDEKAKVFAAMRAASTARTSCAASTSATATSRASRRARTTETFVAARLHIDSWRWAGVPFYVRAGKALARAATEAVVEFATHPACCSTRPAGHGPDRNLVRFRLGRATASRSPCRPRRPASRWTART